MSYGPGGACVISSASPSASDDPSSIEAAAPHTFADAATVTSLALATGTWFGGAQAPMHAPVMVNVYGVPEGRPGATSCTSMANGCPAPGWSNEKVRKSELAPESPR